MSGRTCSHWARRSTRCSPAVPPSVARTPAETVSAILTQDPQALTSSPETLPAGLETVVRRCLEKDPEQRFQSARDLGFALSAVAGSTASGAGSPVAPSRRARWLDGRGPRPRCRRGSELCCLRPRAPATPSALMPVPFTAYPGLEFAPTFSPDGSQIAFAWSPEGIEGQGRPLHQGNRQRESAPSHLESVLLDHPGLVARRAQHRLCANRAPRRRRDLPDPRPGWGRTEAGGDALRLPAGDRAQLVAGRETPRLLRWAHRATGAFRSWTWQRSRRSGWTNPTPSCEWSWLPAFSPDGSSLARVCVLSIGVNDVFVEPVPGGAARRVAHVNGEISGIAWSGDRKSLVFATLGNLMRVPVAGGEPQRLLSGRDVETPAISRDGRRLAYAQHVVNMNIWRVPLTRSPASRPWPAPLISSTRAGVASGSFAGRPPAGLHLHALGIGGGLDQRRRRLEPPHR